MFQSTVKRRVFFRVSVSGSLSFTMYLLPLLRVTVCVLLTTLVFSEQEELDSGELMINKTVENLRINISKEHTIEIPKKLQMNVTNSTSSTPSKYKPTTFPSTTSTIPTTLTIPTTPLTSSSKKHKSKKRKIPVQEMELNRPYKQIDKFLSRSKLYERKLDKKHKRKTKRIAKIEHIKKLRRPIVADVNNNRPIIKDKHQQKNCPTCRKMAITTKQMQKNRRASLKLQLLEKLRMEDSPVLKDPPPRIHKKLFQRFFQGDESERDEDNFYAKTTELFIAGQDVTRTCAHRKSTGCFIFDYKNKIEGKITSAELLVYKFRDGNDGQQTLLVSELERSGQRKLQPWNMVTRIETDVKEGWVSFRLEKTVIRWMSKSRVSSEALSVKCKTCVHTKHKNIFGTKGVYRPILVIRVQPTSLRRSKRGFDCDSGTNVCCKMDYYILFDDIGMNWIMYPKGIWANYCTGSCNDVVAMPGHYNQTKLMQRARLQLQDENLRSSLTPCCGPVVLKTISLMYFNEEGLIRTVHVPNLSIEQCGCL